MGTIRQVIEEHDNYRIVQIGGTVHYKPEFLAYLLRLPEREANRIVAEIEYQARPRRAIKYRRDTVAQKTSFCDFLPGLKERE